MCIRYQINTENLLRWSAATNEWVPYEEYFERLGTFPAMMAPVITLTPNGRNLCDMMWGLTPTWTTDLEFGKKYAYNARSETIAEKPAFREAFRSRRCIVPVSSYWEQHNGRWYRVLPSQDEFFALAGIYEPPEILAQSTFSIVTTIPNQLVSGFNDRMPVVLHKRNIERWLSYDAQVYDLQSLMAPCPTSWMTIEDMGTNKRGKQPKTLPFSFD
jgi:putative SOS response-associated peptidase YedK